MATAVKNPPDTMTASLFDRPAAISLVGVLYVVGSLGIVFKLLPYLFWDVLHFPDSNAVNVVVALFLVAAATGLLILGLWLLGPRAAHGTRAGIVVGALGVLVILLLTRWASLWLEYGSFYEGWYGPSVGALLTALVGLVLLLVGGYYFLQPQVEPYLTQIEDQGWFSATSFKGLQGVRVRRGTILGFLLLAAAGIYTLISHGTLSRLPVNWELNVPFTGKTVVNTATLNNADVVDDFRLKKLHEVFKTDADPLIVDRYALRDFNRQLADYVEIDTPGESEFTEASIVKKDDFDKVVQDLNEHKRVPPTAKPIPAVYGKDTFATIQLLPSIMYTLPVLLMALALWLAWRIVNYPAFADFLIATEAEMNKVSWSKRKDLIKDTIVVLATVFLMAAYLFAMDQAWSHLLSWKPIRVLQIHQDNNEAAKSIENKPW